jgi:hemerythrin-like domain-containing protein
MSNIASLRAQHDAVEAMINDISADLAHCPGNADADAYPLSLKLARLAGSLRSHLSAEAETLYPAMIESAHREAALAAHVFRDEVTHLAARFERFVERWSDAAAIAAARRQFRFEAGMLFAALRDRIHRENRDLFPLAEEAGARKAALAFARAPDAMTLSSAA